MREYSEPRPSPGPATRVGLGPAQRGIKLDCFSIDRVNAVGVSLHQASARVH